MSVLVTGVAGFIGSHVARALLARGEAVVGVDNFSDYYDPILKFARLKTLREVFIVASGIGLASLFLWLSGELSDLTLVDTAWQSWLPRVVALALSLLLLLSLLAFMDARSTGGAAVWAGFILCWMGVHSVAAILHAAWPKGADAIDLGRIPHDTLLAWTSTPLLTALFSIGLAQLMAAGVADATQRRNTTSMRPPPNGVRNLSSV